MKTENKLFTQEFIDHTRDLRRIQLWFLDYLEKNEYLEDTITHDVLKIEDYINKTAYHIGELVAVEFRENAYYKKILEEEIPPVC